MSHEVKVHEAQTIILRELLFLPEANFAALQKATNLPSDHAKFHINRLVELEYLDKNGSVYSLSVKGKEYANRLDTDDNTIERQPKSSCIMALFDKKSGKFIMQQRLKNPYFGFIGFYTGKIRWGESIFGTAVRETLEETGLTTKAKDWKHRGVFHEVVRHKTTGEIVEDKIFHCMYCDKFTGDLIEKYEGGRNILMTIDEVRADPKHFRTFEIEAAATKKNVGFQEVFEEYGDEF